MRRRHSTAQLAVFTAALQLMLFASGATAAPRLSADMRQWVGASEADYQQLQGPGSKLAALKTVHGRPFEYKPFWDRSMLQQGTFVENFQQVGVSCARTCAHVHACIEIGNLRNRLLLLLH